MLNRFLSFVLFFTGLCIINGQSLFDKENDLKEIGINLVLDSLPQTYTDSLSKVFISELISALEMDSLFEYPFDSLKMILIQYPDDKSFRIITWQEKDSLGNKRFKYKGLIQHKGSKKIIILNDFSKEVDDIYFDILDEKTWFGAVYYRIKGIKRKGETYYLLFGYNAWKEESHLKLIDVLTFNDEGKPIFGLPVFRFEKGSPSFFNRFYLNYYSKSSIKLNYDDYWNKIIFDHLVEIHSNYGDGDLMVGVPDGTYEGFILKKGEWIYQRKVFDKIINQPPNPNPVFDKKSNKNIFGK